MTESAATSPSSPSFDPATRELVRLAAVIAAGSESAMRLAMASAASTIEGLWVEELILQSYLFGGFPRSLNAMREWRRVARNGAATLEATGAGRAEDDGQAAWRARGEATCATVYGETYERLRANVRRLHPELDEWMIVEGYGKVLGRPGLDLRRRELCIVAACAATGQDRQLHAHLRGALNAGASPQDVDSTLSALADIVPPGDLDRIRMLWSRVQGK
jgi:4-carboxymuconolactone decarboxylase